jgi:hypothetical protein
MLRRDFVRAIVSVGLAPKWLLSQQAANPAPPPPAPMPWTLGLNPKTPLPQTEVSDDVASTVERFFTPVQMATLVRFSDILLPAIGERPGALQAGTPLFLDFLIGSSPATRKKVYIDGLNWLDSESQKRYSKKFADLDDKRADSILKPLLRTWMTDHPPTEPHADFVNIAHDDIRTATINSESWSETSPPDLKGKIREELYWYPIDPDIYGRDSDEAGRLVHIIAAPKSAHAMLQYSR